MTFFNKKQEVIDVQLTRFGKNLLSRGAFVPEYYQFFDDDIIYNIDKTGTTEEQNESETRIRDGIRLKTQHTTVSLEKSFEEQKKLIESGQRGVFLKMRRQMPPLEKDKLLMYPLANYKIASQQAPYYALSALDAQISGSLKYPNPLDNGIYKNRPEITIKPKYSYTVDRRSVRNLEDQDIIIDSEAFIDVTKPKIEFLDGSTIERHSEDFIIDLEEFATSYGLDNFELEIYEETEAGSEEYVLMLEEEEIYKFINVKTDKTVSEISRPSSKSRNFYSD